MDFKVNQNVSSYSNLSNCLLIIALVAMFSGCSTVTAQTLGKPLVLPTKYDEDRFYVQPVTLDGTTINFFTDTGGAEFIYSDVVERLKLPVTKRQILGSDGRIIEIETVTIPKFIPKTTIPSPLNKEYLRISAAENRSEPCSLCSKNWSGLLGPGWFAGRVWTFDYPKQQLLLRADDDLPKVNEKHRVSLGFQTDALGMRKSNYPRIQVAIDGKQIDLLFDTGATILLSSDALAALKDNRPAVRSANFIVASIFDNWRKQHPKWRFIEHSNMVWGENDAQAMIEIPQITIAGFTVGPVWFTRQPDSAFHEYMSRSMDKRIEGALGGNALRHFRITIDYPRAIAVFEK